MFVHAALLRTVPIGCSMHNLLRCRRGSAAFATVAALVPLIGVVSLGAEAGSWYVTKQHAQNAADAAAISGALRLACSISGSSNCDAAQDYVYRGKQFAAQTLFWNAGDSPYPGSNCASLPTGNVTDRSDRSFLSGGYRGVADLRCSNRMEQSIGL